MKAGLILVTIVAVLLAVWMLRRSGERPINTSDMPDDPDGQVLRQLVLAGSDLSKPHDAEFFLYFPDEERASKACRELTAEGYTGKVERAAQGPSWLCFVTKQIIPSHGVMVAIRKRMSELARAGGGEYDGWGAPVMR